MYVEVDADGKSTCIRITDLLQKADPGQSIDALAGVSVEQNERAVHLPQILVQLPTSTVGPAAVRGAWGGPLEPQWATAAAAVGPGAVRRESGTPSNIINL